MESKLGLIKKIESAFRQLLELSEEIEGILKQVETAEDLEAVAGKLHKRDELICEINALHAMEASQEEGTEEAYEKYRWLCREIVKKISKIDRENMETMDAMMERFMEQVRVSRQSIRAVNAYAAQGVIE